MENGLVAVGGVGLIDEEMDELQKQTWQKQMENGGVVEVDVGLIDGEWMSCRSRRGHVGLIYGEWISYSTQEEWD